VPGYSNFALSGRGSRSAPANLPGGPEARWLSLAPERLYRTILLLNLAYLLKTATWPSVLPSIVDAAERDPELAAVYSQIQLGHATPYLEVIERGKRKGEVSSALDGATMVAELVGPLFYRRWFSREALDERFVKSVVATVIGKT
jgi:hypothetical protein